VGLNGRSSSFSVKMLGLANVFIESPPLVRSEFK
jgi:hypothetical protein